MTANLLFAIVFAPVVAAYDFVTNPHAPPQIFVAQFTDAFGHPPGQRPTPVAQPKAHKRVYVSRS